MKARIHTATPAPSPSIYWVVDDFSVWPVNIRNHKTPKWRAEDIKSSTEIGQRRRNGCFYETTLTRNTVSFSDSSFLYIFKPTRTVVGEIEMCKGESNEESANHIADESGNQGPDDTDQHKSKQWEKSVRTFGYTLRPKSYYSKHVNVFVPSGNYRKLLTGAPSIIATGIEYIFAVCKSYYLTTRGLKQFEKHTDNCAKRHQTDV